ncbi:MAG: hypothetical protein A2284_09335 [Deltaproteobacteria bacterium RIFOXYA12_FULL_61_11]|nr:MAG: hypothetical protein A2284_09335 [Deltaproteobacteria bacterium RIFOXYA12_FULL_61_11]
MAENLEQGFPFQELRSALRIRIGQSEDIPDPEVEDPAEDLPQQGLLDRFEGNPEPLRADEAVELPSFQVLRCLAESFEREGKIIIDEPDHLAGCGPQTDLQGPAFPQPASEDQPTQAGVAPREFMQGVFGEAIGAVEHDQQFDLGTEITA